jgi:hypothetical protein
MRVRDYGSACFDDVLAGLRLAPERMQRSVCIHERSSNLSFDVLSEVGLDGRKLSGQPRPSISATLVRGISTFDYLGRGANGENR